ncbi:glial fibrillary acidic protein-like [Arapaima gigas]
MLRVSSYRRLFEEAPWKRGSGVALRCGSYRRAPAGAPDCWREEPDFATARVRNKEAACRLVRERTLMAELNNRLAFLIETARCLEEENESLEAQVIELEEGRSGQTTVAHPGVPVLSPVVERLRREKGEILCNVAELQQKLDCLQKRHKEVVNQTSLVLQEREDVAADVDAVTAECLALRDQVDVYSEQLAAMQEEHDTTVETLLGPTAPAGLSPVTLRFPGPDVTPLIQEIKKYYCDLTEGLQFGSKAAAAVTLGETAKKERAPAQASAAEVTDPAELRKQIAELQKELAELLRCGEDLEDQVESRRVAHLEEVAELQCCAAQLQRAQAALEAKMKEHCGDYDELLGEKMLLDAEIAAYRVLVEEEEARRCSF